MVQLFCVAVPSQIALSCYFVAASQNESMRLNKSAAAHMIHGSSEGRFKITYAPGKLTREEIENVGYGYMDLQEALKRCCPHLVQQCVRTYSGTVARTALQT